MAKWELRIGYAIKGRYAASVRYLLLHPIEVRIRRGANMVIDRIDVFPADVRRASIVRGRQVPIYVLVGYRATRVFALQHVGCRISCEITPVSAKCSLMASIQVNCSASVQRVDPIVGFRVEFKVVGRFLAVTIVRFCFGRVPAVIERYLNGRHAISVPVRFRVNGKEDVIELVGDTSLCFVARVAWLGGVNIGAFPTN